jgi:hypothetical protein
MYKTTGIGSLPFTSVEDAVRFSLQFDIPFLPELPKLQTSDKFMKIYFNVSPHICFGPFMKAVGDRQFKWQLPGPYTHSKYSGMPLGLSINLFKTKFNMLSKLLPHDNFNFFIDEPAIDESFELNGEYKIFLEWLKNNTSKVGIHCCNKFKPELFTGLVDILSVDGGIIKESPVPLCLGVVDAVSGERLCEPTEITILISHNCGLLGSTDINNSLKQLKELA